MSGTPEKNIPPLEQEIEKPVIEGEKTTTEKPSLDTEQLAQSEFHAIELVSSLSENAMKTFETLQNEAISLEISEEEISIFLQELGEAKTTLQTALEKYTEELNKLKLEVTAAEDLMKEFELEETDDVTSLKEKLKESQQETQKREATIRNVDTVGTKAQGELSKRKEGKEAREKEKKDKTAYLTSLKKSGLDINLVIESVSSLDKNGTIDAQLKELSSDIESTIKKLPPEGKQEMQVLLQKYAEEKTRITKKIDALSQDFVESDGLKADLVKAETVKANQKLYDNVMSKIKIKRQTELDTYTAEKGVELQTELESILESEEKEKQNILKKYLGDELVEKTLLDESNGVDLKSLTKELAQKINPQSKSLDYKMIRNLSPEVMQEIVNNLDIEQVAQITKNKGDLIYSREFIQKKEKLVSDVIQKIENGDLLREQESLSQTRADLYTGKIVDENKIKEFFQKINELRKNVGYTIQLVDRNGHFPESYPQYVVKDSDYRSAGDTLSEIDDILKKHKESPSYIRNFGLEIKLKLDYQAAQEKEVEFKKQEQQEAESKRKKEEVEAQQRQFEAEENARHAHNKEILLSSKDEIVDIVETSSLLDSQTDVTIAEMEKNIQTKENQKTFIEKILNQIKKPLDAETQISYTKIKELHSSIDLRINNLKKKVESKKLSEEAIKKYEAEKAKKAEEDAKYERDRAEKQKLESEQKKVELLKELDKIESFIDSSIPRYKEIEAKIADLPNEKIKLSKVLDTLNSVKFGVFKKSETLQDENGQDFEVNKKNENFKKAEYIAKVKAVEDEQLPTGKLISESRGIKTELQYYSFKEFNKTEKISVLSKEDLVIVKNRSESIRQKIKDNFGITVDSNI
ncbi:MAG: hypothetical protein WC025_00285 [Candidatus Magasanikbacteria bacterium]